MRILPVLIIWAFVIFLLPKLLGSKKRSKQEKLPTAPAQEPGNTTDTASNKDFWRNWGIEEPPMQAENMTPKNIQSEPMSDNRLKHGRRSALAENVDALPWEEKPNAWNGKITKKAIKRGLIMKEVLGPPRALKPYGKDV